METGRLSTESRHYIVVALADRYITGSQLGVVRKKLGVVQKFNMVRTCKLAFRPRSASDHAKFVHMQCTYNFHFILKFKVFNK